MLVKKQNRLPTIRVHILLCFFFIFAAFVIFRLFVWQVVKSEKLGIVGNLQQKTSKNVFPSRGSIISADGFPLAVSGAGWVVWADPRAIKDAKDASEKLAPILIDKESEREATASAQLTDEGKAKLEKEKLENEKERLWGLLTRKGAWVPLKHKIDSQTKEKIEQLAIAGIGFEGEERRTYPEASMGAHLVGFVGHDEAGNDKGYFGLEGKYDVVLSGAGGQKSWERDALGNPILNGTARGVAALDGADLKTHIDRTIEYLAEGHLARGIQKYGASSGTVIIARPDGAILAMSSLPSYPPEDFSKYKEEDFINPAISHTFEPGSIFKVLVMSAALDAKVIDVNDHCDCSGPSQIGKYAIKTWNNQYHPNSTPADIIKHSDNIGMVWVGERLGADSLYDYLNNFGIGSLTGIDLQGETTGFLRPKGRWGQIDLATTSFGQGIAVTPIQMVRAVSAIANKGYISMPQVVGKVVGSGFEEDIKPQVGRRVISEDTVEKITSMMVNAVKNGEARWAAPKGFSIAGKTGTAQVPIAGHYDPNKTNASFIGFAPACAKASAGRPACEPKFVMMVTLHQPTSSPWAAETAAPLWFNIARDLFVYFGIRPTE